ncbi:MAG: phosphoadenosine phosphosulfate reductase family protein [Selenomonas sp.]|nr:phosphoadenosine phosphosulfate reductase family protein [Selenomonas sp.]
MWCKVCERETEAEHCEVCSSLTEADVPVEIYYCQNCQIPIVVSVNEKSDKICCSNCGVRIKRLCKDLRPVFPEERLLLEILTAKPLAYLEKSVWACGSRYYIDGKSMAVPLKVFAEVDTKEIRQELEKWRPKNSYEYFEAQIKRFIAANVKRLTAMKEEAFRFIRETAAKFPQEQIVLSFSGGKDSTVTADLAVRALANPSLVHIFGNTTLEFPMTMAYAERFRKCHPQAIFKVAQNKEQNFYEVCSDIGPPARMLRWCCTMFKTGPITRALNSLFRGQRVLTFYGVRKFESVSRSKYKRVEDDASSVKIQRQTVASPVFLWHDIDIWLYILGEGVDFNEAYRLGYDRVGCWCCPNNNVRAMFLSNIYMPEAAEKWHSFLVDFARRIGKPDPEEYVDSGNWKSRQGGNGVKAAEDVKLKFANCTAEENAKIYRLKRPMSKELTNLFAPIGIVSEEMGRKMLHEVMILEPRTKVPIMSLQPFQQDGYDYALKVKTMNVADHEALQRMAGYQVRKFNACRRCLKCESLCPHGAIKIQGGNYEIDESKCKRCKMCVTAKYLDGGCLMDKFLKTNTEK